MSSSSVIFTFPVGTDGQLLTGVTGADPIFSTPLSADNTIEFTAGAGTVDFSYRGTIDTNVQVASYQLVLADRGNLITINNDGATNLTVPPNATEAFPIGTSILVAQMGAGQVTVVAGAGVVLLARFGLVATSAQYAMLTIVKVLENHWLVSGDVS